MRTGGNFGLLVLSREEYLRQGYSFAMGCVAATAALLLLVVPSLYSFTQGAPRDNYLLTTLPSSLAWLSLAPKERPAPPVHRIERPQPVPHQAPRLRPVARVPRLQLPVPEPPKMDNAPLLNARVPPPLPALATASPGPALPAPPTPFNLARSKQLAGMGGNDRIPLKKVQTGGFGSPEGIRGDAAGGSPGNLPKLGSFDLPEGPGQGNGTGGASGMARKVATTGFGDGGLSTGVPGSGPAGAPVKTGLFNASESSPGPAPPAAALAPEIHPVEILVMPTPRYTEEARRLHIQGEVVLSVIFQANGTIKVLAVLHSLGHGLDEMAQEAASQIHFKPAQQAGKPTDFPATLRIEFRMA